MRLTDKDPLVGHKGYLDVGTVWTDWNKTLVQEPMRLAGSKEVVSKVPVLELTWTGPMSTEPSSTGQPSNRMFYLKRPWVWSPGKSCKWPCYVILPNRWDKSLCSSLWVIFVDNFMHFLKSALGATSGRVGKPPHPIQVITYWRKGRNSFPRWG